MIINRIDSICHAILKGKWPSTNQQYESPSSLSNTCVSNSAPQRAGYVSARVQPTPSLNFGISAPASHLSKVTAVRCVKKPLGCDREGPSISKSWMSEGWGGVAV